MNERESSGNRPEETSRPMLAKEIVVPIIKELIEALRWCGGSAEFARGGDARNGWIRIVIPAIDRGLELIKA